MDNISLNNLFPNAKISNTPLDVRTLYDFDDKIKKKEFNVKSLIIEKEEKQQKIYDEYRRIYSILLTRIKAANKLNKTSLIYKIPIAVYACNNYLPIECLDYIENKLVELGFEIEIMSETSIFVNWTNLGKKIKNEN